MKQINKKGEMELSVSTIIIVAIGVTVIILGLLFIRDIFHKITEEPNKEVIGLEYDGEANAFALEDNLTESNEHWRLVFTEDVEGKALKCWDNDTRQWGQIQLPAELDEEMMFNPNGSLCVFESIGDCEPPKYSRQVHITPERCLQNVVLDQRDWEITMIDLYMPKEIEGFDHESNEVKPLGG